MLQSFAFLFRPSRLSYLALVLTLSVGACSWYPDPYVTNKRVQVEEEKIAEEYAYGDLSEAALVGLAQHHNRYGDGPLTLTLAYNPKSKAHTARQASEKAAELSGILRREGVHNVETNILPVKDLPEPKVMISYLGYKALAPEDCGLMPGLRSRQIEPEIEEDYKLGCSVETYFARQISRPSDLLGQEIGGNTDGRRSANQIEAYRAGVPNETLEGQSASD